MGALFIGVEDESQDLQRKARGAEGTAIGRGIGCHLTVQ